MNRKRFIALAATLNANHATLALVQDMADMCEEFNPLFDRAVFIDASTVNLQKSLTTDLRILNRETKEN